MKNLVYIISTVLALSGYVKPTSDCGSFAEIQQVLISVIPDLSKSYEFTIKKSKADPAEQCNRYTLEVYSDPDYSMQVSMQQQTEDRDFILKVDHNKTYYVLLWAHKETSTVYGLESIRDLKFKSGEIQSGTFLGKLTIEGRKTHYEVSLESVEEKQESKEIDALPSGMIATSNF